MQSAKSMRRGSVRNAVNVLTSINAVSALIQSFIANLELSVSSGKCQETEGKKTLRRGDGEMGRIEQSMRYALCPMRYSLRQ